MTKHIENDEISDLAKEIYLQLPPKTASGFVVIRPGYGRQAYERAIREGAICALRCWWLDNHFGNPFTSDPKIALNEGMTLVPSTRHAVAAYIDWVITSEHYRAEWIRYNCKNGGLTKTPIHYYKELGEPSHANALDYLINVYNWDK